MVDPRGMSITQWADAVLLSVGDAWSYPRLDDEVRWRDWAVAFLRSPTFANQALPDPYGFNDWQEWAERAYPMLEASN